MIFVMNGCDINLELVWRCTMRYCSPCIKKSYEMDVDIIIPLSMSSAPAPAPAPGQVPRAMSSINTVLATLFVLIIWSYCSKSYCSKPLSLVSCSLCGHSVDCTFCPEHARIRPVHFEVLNKALPGSVPTHASAELFHSANS